jgi:hypothetical protein
MTSSTQTPARAKLAAATDRLPLDKAIAGLVHLNTLPTTPERVITRVALIESIERRFPAVKAWVEAFYDVELDHANWDIDTVDAILLAVDELGL